MSKINKFNPEILSLLSLYEIPRNSGLTCLLAYYYDTQTDYIPAEIHTQLLAAGIISFDMEDNLIWNISLFEGEVASKFDWVEKEYCPMFLQHDSKMLPFEKESKIRMIKFFKENPDIRKDDVINAVELYFKEKPYPMVDSPHYFIEKGRGVDKVCKLYNWVMRLRELESGSETKDISSSAIKWS